MKIGLALSSGGALGAAHIGVIESLEQNHVKIDAVCGSSAGAIVGLLYASGGMPAIDQFFDTIINVGMFKPKNIIKSPRPDLIFQKIEQLLHDITNATDFSQLKMPFSCVATNLETGENHIFDSGDPIKAVMASAAYPGVFPTQIIDGRHYIDGGTRLNLPIQPLKKQKVDFIIASSIYKLSKLDTSKKISRVQTVIRAIEIMECSLNDNELKKADFAFLPPVRRYFWYNFSSIDKIRQISQKYSQDRIQKLLSLLADRPKSVRASRQSQSLNL